MGNVDGEEFASIIGQLDMSLIGDARVAIAGRSNGYGGDVDILIDDITVSQYISPTPSPTCEAYLTAGSAEIPVGATAVVDFTLSDTIHAPGGIMEAFGVYVGYDQEKLTFLDVTPGELVEDWQEFGASEQEPGVIAVGGYDMAGATSSSSVTLFSLAFQPKLGAVGTTSTLDLYMPVDDIENYCLTDGSVSISCGASLEAENLESAANNPATVDFVLSDTDVLPDRIMDAFGAHIAYNTGHLEFIEAASGELIADWQQFNVSEPEPGHLIVGGFDQSGSSSSEPATLFSLTFIPKLSSVGMTSVLDVYGEVNDLAEYCMEDGSIYIMDRPCLKGDVNCDGAITPGDALVAFQMFLQVYVPDAEAPCDQACAADYDLDELITPGDALCIFRDYVGVPCE